MVIILAIFFTTDPTPTVVEDASDMTVERYHHQHKAFGKTTDIRINMGYETRGYRTEDEAGVGKERITKGRKMNFSFP